MPKEDDLLDWVARQWPGLGRNAAQRLLERAGGDLGAVREAGVKARATGLLEEKYIAVLCEPPPGGQFAELLVAGDRAGALAAARTGDRRRARRSGCSIPGWARWRRSGRASAVSWRTGTSPGKLGVPRFLIGAYRDVAQAYGPARVRRCRELLATADAAWRSGAVAGVAEVLAANW